MSAYNYAYNQVMKTAGLKDLVEDYWYVPVGVAAGVGLGRLSKRLNAQAFEQSVTCASGLPHPRGIMDDIRDALNDQYSIINSY